MSRKISPRLVIILLLGVFFIVAAAIRVLYPLDSVTSGGLLKFTSVDAYYHLRMVDNLVHHFPHAMSFDPFFIYPGGNVVNIRFFDWFLGLIIWVLTLGSATQHSIDVISMAYPVALAALTVIPVYFIGKALYNRWVGVMAAGLIAIIPGEWLGRSILGFTDQHVMETLLSTTTVLFLIMALKTARERGLSFAHVRQRDWSVLKRPLIYTALAGLFLGVYHLTWIGALLFPFLIAVYFIVQFVINHIRNEKSDYLLIVGVPVFLIALLLDMPFWSDLFTPISLTVAIVMLLVLWWISRFMMSKGIRGIYYPLALVVTGGVALALFLVIFPGFGHRVLNLFSIFSPAGSSAQTTMEMRPFLSPQGQFSLGVAWGNFTTGFYVSLAVLLFLLVYKGLYRRKTSNEEVLFIIWSLIILVATLGQRRFAYYFAVNVALLCAYFSWQVIWYAGLKRWSERAHQDSDAPDRPKPRAGRKKQRRAKRSITVYGVNTVLAIIVVFFFVFYPNFNESRKVASAPPYAPSDGWYQALYWMRDNTPEPFGNADAYYQDYPPPAPGQKFAYPATAYGVTAWWDYGYWITRVAHRLPSDNPSQAPGPIKNVAAFFLSDNETAAASIRAELGTSYVMIDDETCTSKFWAIATWDGKNTSDYSDIYYVLNNQQLVPVQLFYPAYYRSLVVRMYNFDGKAVTTEQPMVIHYETKRDSKGNIYQQILDGKSFNSYSQAVAYMNSQTSGSYKIVGTNPYISPIALDALTNYKLVYSSQAVVSNSNGGSIPEVKVFEYTGNQ